VQLQHRIQYKIAGQARDAARAEQARAKILGGLPEWRLGLQLAPFAERLRLSG
jgi:hypothetical protein